MKAAKHVAMRTLVPTFALALGLAGSSAVGAQEDGQEETHALAGTWEITSSGGQFGDVTSTLTIAFEEGELKGRIVTVLSGMGRVGGGAGGARVRPGGGRITSSISDITVEGESFTFVALGQVRGRSFSTTYAGTFSGDEMEGTIQGQRGESRPFRGTRKPQ